MANTQPNQFIIDEEEADYEHRLNAILIDEDRYHGAYSHHGYTAWLNRIPSDTSAGDTTCGEFWRQNTLIFGGGNTPDEAAGVPNYVIEDFKEMLLKKHDFSLFCIDLFITDKGEWGIFEFCPNFGVGSVPNSLCPNETKIFIERVLKRMSHMKETGNGLC